MEIVNKVLDECNLRKWLVSEKSVDEIKDIVYFDESEGVEKIIPGYEKTFHTFEFENDFWKWRIDFEECLDCEPGILAIRELFFKSDLNLFTKQEYYGDLLCQNTSLGTRNNFLDLINSKNLDEYFENKFSILETLEENLKEKYIFKIQFPLKSNENWDLNNRIRKTYKIELYDRKGKSIATLIPLVGERRNNYDEERVTINFRDIQKLPYHDRMKILNRDHGEYRLYVFPSYEKILELKNKKHIEYFDWNINCRNFHIYRKGSNIPFFSENLRTFSNSLETFIEKVK